MPETVFESSHPVGEVRAWPNSVGEPDLAILQDLCRKRGSKPVLGDRKMFLFNRQTLFIGFELTPEVSFEDSASGERDLGHGHKTLLDKPNARIGSLVLAPNQVQPLRKREADHEVCQQPDGLGSRADHSTQPNPLGAMVVAELTVARPRT